MRSFLYSIFVSLLFLCMTCTAGCGTAARDTISPETALKELQLAVRERDAAKVASYVDLDRFLENTYDSSARETALAVETLHERYPEDPFFWHDTKFMQQYAIDHRGISLQFMKKILSHYFSKESPAASYDEDPESWLSGELGKLHAAGTAEIREIRHTGPRHASVFLQLKGDNTPYGKFTDGILLELGMEQQEHGGWKVTGIENIPDLILPVADKAEMFWTFQGWQ